MVGVGCRLGTESYGMGLAPYIGGTARHVLVHGCHMAKQRTATSMTIEIFRVLDMCSNLTFGGHEEFRIVRVREE